MTGSTGAGLRAELPDAVRRHLGPAEDALRSAVDRLPPRLRRVVAYHRGWVDVDGRARAGAGGKALRPVLALLGAQAAGTDLAAALPGAVAVELVHDFSLLHDDLMDGDTERRHRPTAWTAFGVADALLAGDALLGLAGRLLLDGPVATAVPASRLLQDTVARLVEGQSLDVGFEPRTDVTLEECLAMAEGKTAALLSCSCAIGAVLGGADDGVVAGLAAFGTHVGVAFQVVDDLLGIWGDPAVTGKPVLSDLRSRKKSIPVVVAVQSGTEAGRRLAGYLASGHQAGEDELHRLAGLVEDAGGRAWACEEADRRLELALAGLEGLNLSRPVTAELTAVARFVTTRDR